MDVDELLQTAWAAVKKTDMPESLRAVALKEAIDYLRSSEDSGGGPSRPRKAPKKAGSRGHGKDENSNSQAPDEDAFFSQLSSESGVEESQLRDILKLEVDGKIHVLPPTRDLGSSKSEQAKRVVALVAGARAHGLGERPLDGAAVREEVQRKHCYDRANFGNKTVRQMKGFNTGPKKGEISLTSKWVEEFQEAAAIATGSDPSGA